MYLSASLAKRNSQYSTKNWIVSEKKSFIDVQGQPENSISWVHRFQRERRRALFPTRMVDPQVRIILSPLNTNNRFHLSIRAKLFWFLLSPAEVRWDTDLALSILFYLSETCSAFISKIIIATGM